MKTSPHKSYFELKDEMKEYSNKIKIGGTYSHYKHPENLYIVTGLAVLESTDEICVLYDSIDNRGVIFVRPVESFLETVELNGVNVPRFKSIEK